MITYVVVQNFFCYKYDYSAMKKQNFMNEISLKRAFVIETPGKCIIYIINYMTKIKIITIDIEAVA